MIGEGFDSSRGMSSYRKSLLTSGEPVGKGVDPVGMRFGPLQPLLALFPFLWGKFFTLGPAPHDAPTP